MNTVNTGTHRITRPNVADVSPNGIYAGMHVTKTTLCSNIGGIDGRRSYIITLEVTGYTLVWFYKVC